MSSSTTSSSSGIGFTRLLTVLFIGLKLTGYINWAWWLVLSPLWIGLIVFLFILIIILITALISVFL